MKLCLVAFCFAACLRLAGNVDLLVEVGWLLADRCPVSAGCSFMCLLIDMALCAISVREFLCAGDVGRCLNLAMAVVCLLLRQVVLRVE